MKMTRNTLLPFFSVGATVVVVDGFTAVGDAEPGPDDEGLTDVVGDSDSVSSDPVSLVLSDSSVASLVSGPSLVFSVLLVVPVVVALLSEVVAFVDGRVVFP